MDGLNLDVWDRPERRAEWEAFVRKHNVPDFLGRYANTVEPGSGVEQSRSVRPHGLHAPLPTR